MIPIDSGFEKDILPKAESQTEDEKISTSCDEIVKGVSDYLYNKNELQNTSKEKRDYIINVAVIFITNVLDISEDSAFKSYVKNLHNVNTDMDLFQVELVSERFKRDIYFINGKTRLPYSISATCDNIKDRKAFVVVWVGGNHYEIVGRLLPGNKIQREFPIGDPFIEKLKMFLIYPERIEDEFPELVRYIPREYRNRDVDSPSNYNDSETESEYSKSDYYRSSDEENSSDENTM